MFRRLSALQFFGLMLLMAAVAGGLLGLAGDSEGLGDGLRGAVVMTVGLGLAVGALWFCWAYGRRLDEAAREAHKFAWYWGGSAGLLFTGIGLGMLTADPSLALGLRPPETTPAEWIVLGGVVTVGLQVVGYVVTWIGWWLWKGR